MITRREFLLLAASISLSLNTDAFSLLSEDSLYVFPQGIASGDPTGNSIVLWTRVNPKVHRKLKRKLKLYVSDTLEFSGNVKTFDISPEMISSVNDYTVRFKLRGLIPGKTYYYRFEYGGVRSIPGRFKTFPKNTDSVSIAVVTCQHYADGYYTAYRHISKKDVQFVVHLGDQIYEVSKFAKIPERKLKFPSGEYIAIDIEDYRYLYRTYLSDKDYQLARALHPFIYLWDDHEFANDYAFDYIKGYWNLPNHPYNKSKDRVLELRKAAIKVWHEYSPVDVYLNLSDKNPLRWIKVYRSFNVGNFMQLICTDERSYRNIQPCKKIFLSKGCKEQLETNMLGNTQKLWFFKKLKNSAFLWNVWANEVLFSKLKVFDLYYKLDTWDGYVKEREEILDFLKKNRIFNTVIISGDLHAAVVSNVKYRFEKDSETICPEFMTPALSSINLSERKWWKKFSKSVELFESLQKFQNPWIEYINHRIWGYSILHLTKELARFSIYSVDKYRKDSLEKKEAEFVYHRLKREINRLL